MKKAISLLLVLTMTVIMLSFGSISAFAANEEIQYLSPIYVDSKDVTKGLSGWETKTVTEYHTVTPLDKTWEDGWYVVKEDVTINHSVTCEGHVNLILTNGSKLTISCPNKTEHKFAAINCDAESNHSFKVYAQSTDENTMGKLYAYGGSNAAGIGGDDGEYGAHITINGGKITAFGYGNSAGIGGTNERAGYDITINGGLVTARGGCLVDTHAFLTSNPDSPGAGIGGGDEADGHGITINGGTVYAYGGKGSAGIGGGEENDGYDITINGGTVYAEGYEHDTNDDGGAGIGGGGGDGASKGGNGRDIKINGGEVTAIGGYNGAGIGGGCDDGGASGIVITGGTVYAYGIGGGAGIGGGDLKGTLESITITGGNIYAQCGKDGNDDAPGIGGAGIGGGYEGSAQSIVITGGNITARGGFEASGIGGGKGANLDAIHISGGEIHAYGNANCGIGGGLGGSTGSVYLSESLAAYNVDETRVLLGLGDNISMGKAFFDDITDIKVGALVQPEVEYLSPIYVDGDVKKGISGWETKTISRYNKIAAAPGSNADEIWQSGWYVVSGNITLNHAIRCYGDVKLLLTDGCHLTVKAKEEGCNTAIRVNKDDSFTVYAQSYAQSNDGMPMYLSEYNLYAQGIGISSGIGPVNITINGGYIASIAGSKGGAGIGSEDYLDTENIVINGGNVYAAGEEGGAGIGGGDSGCAHDIIINGGYVRAKCSGGGGAGIGGGDESNGYNIYINGGEVEATGWDGGAGIGGGCESSGTCIYINGGTVKANGSDDDGDDGGAGIGGGGGWQTLMFHQHGGDGKHIYITGGTVEAIGGYNAAGIGGGNNDGNAGDIVISGGLVTAYGRGGGAGIGGGNDEGTLESITISGGTVYARCGTTSYDANGGAGIGGGDKGGAQNITISGGTVTAHGGWEAAGIGGGRKENATSITISDAVVYAYGNNSSGIGRGYKGDEGGTVKISRSEVKAVSRGEHGAAIGYGCKLYISSDSSIYKNDNKEFVMNGSGMNIDIFNNLGTIANLCITSPHSPIGKLMVDIKYMIFNEDTNTFDCYKTEEVMIGESFTEELLKLPEEKYGYWCYYDSLYREDTVCVGDNIDGGKGWLSPNEDTEKLEIEIYLKELAPNTDYVILTYHGIDEDIHYEDFVKGASLDEVYLAKPDGSCVGWYYDENFEKVARIGDVISEDTDLYLKEKMDQQQYGKPESLSEATYLSPVYTDGIVSGWETKTVENINTVSVSDTEWTDGWYISDNITIDHTVICKGNVNLILRDGFTLKINGDEDGAGIDVSGEGASLTVYAQSDITGYLYANGGKNGGAGIGGGVGADGHNIAILGGHIYVTGGRAGGSGIGGGKGANGYDIIIIGGLVDCIGGAEGGSSIGGGLDGSANNIYIDSGMAAANKDRNNFIFGCGSSTPVDSSFFETNTSVSVEKAEPITVKYMVWNKETNTFDLYRSVSAINHSIFSDEMVAAPEGKYGYWCYDEQYEHPISEMLTIYVGNGYVSENRELELYFKEEEPEVEYVTLRYHGLYNQTTSVEIEKGTAFDNTLLEVPMNCICWYYEETFENIVYVGNIISEDTDIYLRETVAQQRYMDGSEMPEIQYLSPVYTDNNDITKGISGWETKSVTEFKEVTKEDTKWTDGWYVAKGSTFLSKSVICTGNVNLILTDGCLLSIDGESGAAAIDVSGENSSLTIYAQSDDKNTMGKLAVVGAAYCAAIGGKNGSSGHSITINGGYIEATAEHESAAIGGGNGANGYDITVNGGYVAATGGERAAAIGGGNKGNGENIVINGGTVEAYGGLYGSGIGGGSNGGSADKIYLNGGNIHAVGDCTSGIGCGLNGTIGNIYMGRNMTATDAEKNKTITGKGLYTPMDTEFFMTYCDIIVADTSSSDTASVFSDSPMWFVFGGIAILAALAAAAVVVKKKKTNVNV